MNDWIHEVWIPPFDLVFQNKTALVPLSNYSHLNVPPRILKFRYVSIYICIKVAQKIKTECQ